MSSLLSSLSGPEQLAGMGLPQLQQLCAELREEIVTTVSHTVREASERKAVVELTVAAAGTVTARGEVVAVRLPESMAGG